MAAPKLDGKSLLSKPKSIAFYVGCAIIAVLFVMNFMYHEPIDEGFLSEDEEFDAYERVNDDPAVFKVSKDGKDIGYLAFASHYGYQSDVVMASLVGLDGMLIDARPYSEDETPSYFQKLVSGGFFDKNFRNVPIEDGFSISTNVDAVSHATISSNASTQAVQKSVSYVGSQYLNTKVADRGNDLVVGQLDIFVIIMLILALVASRFTKKAWIKWVARIYSIVVMGFLAAQFITLSVLVAFFSLDWPSVVDYLRWYLLVFGVLILLLGTGKNLYCNYMCPFGAFQEAEFALGGPLGKKPLNPRVTKIMRWFPGILIFLSLALTLTFHNLGFTCYEPFSLLFGQVGVGVQWALLPIILVAALMSRRVYCTFICPVGYVLGKIVTVRNKVVNRFKKPAGKKPTAAAKAEEAVTVSEKQDVKEESSASAEAQAEETPAASVETQAEETPAEVEEAAQEAANETAEQAVTTTTKAKAPAAKKAGKPMTGRDWIILIMGCALFVVSALTILNVLA